MEDFSSHLLPFLHPTTLAAIHRKNYVFIEEAFPFLDCKLLRKQLKRKDVVQAICAYHDVERKKTFTSFIGLWNLYNFFDTTVPSEYRILHTKQYLRDCQRVVQKPFFWKREDCVFWREGCERKGKFYSRRYMEQQGHKKYLALQRLVKGAVKVRDFAYIYYLFARYNLWNCEECVLIVQKYTYSYPVVCDYFVQRRLNHLKLLGFSFWDEEGLNVIAKKFAWKRGEIPREDTSGIRFTNADTLRYGEVGPCYSHSIQYWYIQAKQYEKLSWSEEEMQKEADIHNIFYWQVSSETINRYCLTSNSWIALTDYYRLDVECDNYHMLGRNTLTSLKFCHLLGSFSHPENPDYFYRVLHQKKRGPHAVIEDLDDIRLRYRLEGKTEALIESCKEVCTKILCDIVIPSEPPVFDLRWLLKKIPEAIPSELLPYLI